jgi:hypothetical protein
MWHAGSRDNRQNNCTSSVVAGPAAEAASAAHWRPASATNKPPALLSLAQQLLCNAVRRNQLLLSNALLTADVPVWHQASSQPAAWHLPACVHRQHCKGGGSHCDAQQLCNNPPTKLQARPAPQAHKGVLLQQLLQPHAWHAAERGADHGRTARAAKYTKRITSVHDLACLTAV